LTANFIVSVTNLSNELVELDTENELEEYIEEKCTEYQEQQFTLLDSQKKKIIGVNIYQNKKDNISEARISITNNISEFEARKSKIDKLNPKVYIANFEEINLLQAPIIMALNTYNIPFQISGVFELVEDAFNAIKLFDPDLVIVNGNNDIIRILKNMLDEYNVTSIDEFSGSSILNNIDVVIEKIEDGE
jgi:methylmalonyl-CoA mutase N-terminal domain/subunit